MPDDQKKLAIGIEATLTGDGAKQAAAELNKVTDAAGAAAKGTGQLADAEKDGAAKAEHLHINHRALHKILHMLGHETAPELGLALTGAMYGPIGAVIALGAAVEFLKKHFEELEEMSKRLESADFLSAIERKRDALHELKQAAFDYRESLKSAAEAEKKFQQDLKDTIELIHERTQAGNKVANAQDSAKVDAINRRTDLSDEQKKVLIDAIHRSAESRGASAETGEKENVIRATAQAKEQAIDKQAELDRRAEESERNSKIFAADQASAKEEAKKLEEKQKELNKAAEEAEAEAKDMRRRLSGAPTTGPEGERARKMQEEADAEAKRLRGIAEQNATAAANLKQHGEGINIFAEDAKNDAAARDTNRQYIADLTHQIEMLNQKLGIGIGANAGAQSAAGFSGDFGHMAQLAGQAQVLAAQHKQVTEAQAAAYQQMIALAQRQHVSLDFLMNNLGIVASAVTSVENRMAALQRLVDRMAASK